MNSSDESDQPDSDDSASLSEISELYSEDYTDISTDEDSSAEDDKCSDSKPTNTKQPRNKVTKSMQNILKELVRKRLLLEEQEMVLAGAAEDVDCEYENNTAVELFKDTPTDSLKIFASFLHYYKPSAYEYVRENYNTPLPELRELCTWCESDELGPGFTKQAFAMLEKKHVEKGKRIICSLVADEFQLFVHQSYVDVNVGGGWFVNDNFCETEGRDVYVLLLVSLEENWKVPVGYFISDQKTKQTEANLINMCLQRSHEVGVDVVSITTTAGLAKLLGCQLDSHKKLKTTFKHPASGNPVAVFADPSLCLRSLYHTFCSKKELTNGQKGKIRMDLIEELGKIMTNKTFQFNFSTDMLELRNILAKYQLISELITPSLGAALEICKNRLKLPTFAGAGPTIEYITMINTLFCILYSKVGQSGYRQPICQENGKEVLEFLEEAKKFISSISYAKPGMGRQINRQLAVEDPDFNSAGFKDLLVSIESLKHLYNSLVMKGVLKCIPTHRLSWDHMDEFLGVILKHNPRQGGSEFEPTYKRFFTDLKSTLIGHPEIESCSITNFKKPVDAIKKSSGKRAFDEHYSVIAEKRRKTEDDKRADENTTKFVKLLGKEYDKMENQFMVGYIAGYIAVHLARTLRCEECIDSLVTNEKLWFHKYITLKELKGICLPSMELFRICWECERSTKDQLMNDSAKRRLLSRVLHLPWATHSFHHIHLTKAIVAKYLRLQLDLEGPRKCRKNQQLAFMRWLRM